MSKKVPTQPKMISVSDGALWADPPPGSVLASDREITAMINRLSKTQQEIIERANPRACRELLPIITRCLDELTGYPTKYQLAEISRLFRLIQSMARSDQD
jgi:hypothetical protein